MSRTPIRLAAAIVLSGLLAVTACCIPYHPLPGQGPYLYSPVPGGNHWASRQQLRPAL